jgi:hypothetical protein
MEGNLMANRRKQLLIALGVFLLSIMIMNRFIGSMFKVHPSEKKSGKKMEVKTQEVFDEEKSKYHPQADDPSKYGIKVQGVDDMPLTEKQWESKMRQNSSGDPAIQESLGGIAKTPQEIDERIADLTAQIKENEAAALNNPNDRNAQEKLQTLYMLKATLISLKERVTAHP